MRSDMGELSMQGSVAVLINPTLSFGAIHDVRRPSDRCD